ncbi:mechanosensitive ion channel protein MscL [Paenibacillus septentrionalis]|uniref:Mechanosensitive ion channel protein MscL n=1 Tax=Paenibacillus septentrionalis TaxID=429342 RepID=A0ABW1V1G4_9BACL
MIVFDVIVDGEKIETLRPMTSRLRELKQFIDQQVEQLVEKYGANVYLSRRFEY